MNPWLELSIQYANQKSYLDDLFRVYPSLPEGIRELDKNIWNSVETAYQEHNNIEVIKSLSRLELFPIKDPYVAYLKRDKKSFSRNPNTIDRICGMLYAMNLGEIEEKCSQPKETNRQMGQSFRNWLNKKSLGIMPVDLDTFISNNENAILDGGDAIMKNFATQFLGYTGEKGLDFVGRFNGKYVIGEAKFLSDFGGHQNAQFKDAIDTLYTKCDNAISIAILDGVLYIPTKNKLHAGIMGKHKDMNIMSSLVLREFLYQI